MIDRILIWLDNRRYKAYSSLEFISIGCFFKALETGDLRYILKLNDYEKLPKVRIDLSVEWKLLYNQYVKECGGYSMIHYETEFRNIITKKELYIKLKHAAFLLSVKPNDELIQLIRDFGFQFNNNTDDDYCNSIINLHRQVQGLGKVIEKKYNEFVRKYESKNKSKLNLYEIINAFEMYKNRRIDIWKTSMKEFLVIQAGYKEWVKVKKNG